VDEFVLVIDASVCGKLLWPEEHSDRAAALFNDADQTGWRLAAPVILPVEMTNLIRRRMRAERLLIERALALLDDFLAQSIDLLTDADLHRAALRLTGAHSLGGHDAHYVALAQRLGCEMWTADERILRAAAGRLAFVRWIGDYVSPPSGGSG
jgi:predicted nucleic acid-binding protein